MPTNCALYAYFPESTFSNQNKMKVVNKSKSYKTLKNGMKNETRVLINTFTAVGIQNSPPYLRMTNIFMIDNIMLTNILHN